MRKNLWRKISHHKQCQCSEPAQQMRHHHHRLELPGNRPHAQQALKQNQDDQHKGGSQQGIGLASSPPGQSADRQDQQPQRGRRVAMDHLYPGLRHVHRPVRESGVRLFDLLGTLRDVDAAVATGPVGTSQTRVGKAHERAQDDDQQGERRGEQRQSAYVHTAVSGILGEGERALRWTGRADGVLHCVRNCTETP